MCKGDVIVREEKRSLLPEILSEALESRNQGPDECERQAEALPVGATDKMDIDLTALVRWRYSLYSLGVRITLGGVDELPFGSHRDEKSAEN